MNYSEKYENISFTNNFAFCKVMQNEEICREVIETLFGTDRVGRDNGDRQRSCAVYAPSVRYAFR